MRNISLVIAIGLVFTLTLGVVLADEISDTKRNDFNAILQHVNCKIQFTEKQIDILSIIDANLTYHKQNLDADYAKMQEFANAQNNRGLLNYSVTEFKEHLKNAVKAIKEVKSNFNKANKVNLTSEQKTQIREMHREAVTTFVNCTSEADKAWTEARVGYLNAWIKKWNDLIAKMKEKGYDTLEMEKVVSDAQNKLIPAIEEIRKSANSAAKKTAMENAKNLHLHLWAEFEMARIRSYLASIEINATAAGYGADVTAIKSKLTEASQAVTTGKRYNPGEFETTWTKIKDAAEMLKTLNKKLKK